MDGRGSTLDAADIPDMDVGYTPVPDDDSEDAASRSLAGTWRFVAAAPGEPPPDTADWRRLDVPGHWNHEGFSVDTDERGWYRRRVAVPDGWGDRRLLLRFDGVYSDAVVWANGTRVGTHEGGYTPFEVDLTDALDTGEIVLHVGVREHSVAASLTQWSLGGGIIRDVRLLSVPACHLADVDVRTQLTDDGDRATIRATVRVANDSLDRMRSARVHLRIDDPDGEEVGRASENCPIAARTGRSVELECVIDDPETWDPEHPRLHDLAIDLEAGDQHERFSTRTGLREISVDGDQLRLNGKSVTLRGVAWRECHPDHGLAIPSERTARDAELLREANVNYVRTGHHPPTEAFLSACDELGIVVELEAPLAGIRFGRANVADDPAHRRLVCRQVLESIARDRNRTSVCVWSIANESEWGPNFEAAARLANRADPTRPTTFNWGMYREDDVGFCDIANHHYPALRQSTVDLDDFHDIGRPVLFGEFCHLYATNVEELCSDPGLRDDYERVLERSWERVCELDAFSGAAIWHGVDHPEPEFRWGILDRFRRRRPEYWHVRKTYAPVQLAAVEWRDQAVRLRIENRMTFANLDERRIRWTNGDSAGVLDVDAAPGETAMADIPLKSADDPIHLEARHPDGFAINEWELRPGQSIHPAAGRATGSGGDLTRSPRSDQAGALSTGACPVGADPNIPDTDATRAVTESTITVETPEWNLTVGRYDGRVTLTSPGADEPLLAGIPALAVSTLQPERSSPPRYAGTRRDRLLPWRCEAVEPLAEATGVAIRGGYYYDTLDKARGRFELRPAEDGRLSIGYEFTLETAFEARQVGLAVGVPGALRELSWSRDARWSSYPDDHIGRPTGTATAFPNDDRPTDDVARLDRSRAWARDATRHGSNDFRSTKRNIRTARLAAPDGRAIEVHATGNQHVRCAIQDGGVDLLVLDGSIAGGGLSLLDRHGLLDERPSLEVGTELRGRAVFGVGDTLSEGDHER